MANEAAAMFSGGGAAGGARAVGSEQLAQGLLLMRASAIKVMRLQLAMERRDRRAALETVDDLMRLDRRISDLLDDLPAASPPLVAVREEVDAQGQALAREKLTLAAGMAGPRLAPRPPWQEPEPAAETESEPEAMAAVEAEVVPVQPEPEPRRLRRPLPAPADTIELPVEPELELEPAHMVEIEAPSPRRGSSSRLLAALLLLFLILAGAAAYLILSGTGAELIARIPSIDGVR